MRRLRDRLVAGHALAADQRLEPCGVERVDVDLFDPPAACVRHVDIIIPRSRGGAKSIRSTSAQLGCQFRLPALAEAVDGYGHAVSHHAHADHDHSHGLVDRSIVRSREGVRAVATSLGILGAAAVIQAVIFVASGSVALLADLIHNAGDALTAVPLGIAFVARSARGERWAGYAVVFAIFVSACVALAEAIDRLLHPQDLSHLWALAAAGGVGFIGNEIAARLRLRAGVRLASPALIADGNHARVDGFVSLGVVASAAMVGLGLEVGDPIIGLAITLVILTITRNSWRTVREGRHGP